MSEAIGSLRARVILESPARVADEIGGTAIAWIDQGEVWAAIEVQSAGAGAAFDTIAAAATYRVSIRAPSPARAGWRVVWGMRVLRIIAVRDDGGASLTLQCEEETL